MKTNKTNYRAVDRGVYLAVNRALDWAVPHALPHLSIHDFMSEADQGGL